MKNWLSKRSETNHEERAPGLNSNEHGIQILMDPRLKKKKGRPITAPPQKKVNQINYRCTKGYKHRQ